MFHRYYKYIFYNTNTYFFQIMFKIIFKYKDSTLIFLIYIFNMSTYLLYVIKDLLFKHVF